MKKAIVVVILVVYIASIAIVNFFGLEIKVFDKNIYVASVQVDSVTVHRADGSVDLVPSGFAERDGKLIPVYTFEFIPSAGDPYTREEESLLTNPNAVQIVCRVNPDNATNSAVKYIPAKDSPFAYFDEVRQTAVFISEGALTVTVEALDGHGAKTQLIIYASASAQS